MTIERRFKNPEITYKYTVACGVCGVGRCGYLPGKEGLTKDGTELHYGKCRTAC